MFQENKTVEAENVVRLPPKSSEEWLERMGKQEWPEHVEGEDAMSLFWDFSSKDGIKEDLKRFAPLDISIIEEVEAQLLQLENRLHSITDNIVETRGRATKVVSTITGGLRAAPQPVFLTEFYDHEVVATRQPTVQKKARETSGKSVKGIVFPGFNEDELTSLPAQLESPQVLVQVSNAQKFKPGFKKLWQHLFVSEASVAIVQDAFWWFFLDSFQDFSYGSDKAKLFGRIADSFVALFSNVKPDFKDKFFKHYADCIAQAVFSAFCQAFPGSRTSLHSPLFKDYLLNVLSEWITGIRPPPRSWLHWNVHSLDPGLKDTGEGQLTADSSQSDPVKKLTRKGSTKFALGVSLMGLGHEETTSPPGGLARQLTRRSTVLPPVQPETAQVDLRKQSLPIGRGTQYERVLFDTKGRSPLVTQYLQSKQLLSEGDLPGDAMTRTQVVKLPSPGPTYKDFIRHSKKVSSRLNDDFRRDYSAFMAEEKRIRRERRRVDSEFKRVTEEIMSRQHEVKMLSERLLGVVQSSGGTFGSMLADITDPLGLSETSLLSNTKGGAASTVSVTNGESSASRTVSRSASRLSMTSDFNK
eukprot:m.53141 g.53141  ORF g.53141 m.53141 type:complete len:584 (+) comp34239_c0_seq32:1489-3240(+)